jgi:hypothetical protein
MHAANQHAPKESRTRQCQYQERGRAPFRVDPVSGAAREQRTQQTGNRNARSEVRGYDMGPTADSK